MLRVDLVHSLEVVEVLEEDRRLDEPVEAGARLLEDRLQVREDLLGLLLDPARDRGVARLQAELPGDEDEAAGARSPASTARPGTAPAQPRCGRRSCRSSDVPPVCSHASARAAPSALKIASSTWPLSVPFEEPHVQDEPGVLGEHLEEASHDVGAEPADAGLRQVDVRDEERLVARLEHDVGERLRRGRAHRSRGRARPPRAAAPRARCRSPPRRPRPLPACLPARCRGRGRTAQSRRGARAAG